VAAVACCPGKYGNKGERQVYMAGYQPQKGMGWSQEGIDWYNELFKETVLNQKESWANDFEMDVVESLKE
jgi:hypothetical protein